MPRKTENIVALCDVDFNRGAANLKKFDKPPKYKDFRVMLDKEGKNIDAVTIGIPDFMHATVALACMQRGKHVYCEKPLTRTPWEARLLQEAAAKYKVATQMGNQGFSHECNRVAAEIVWSRRHRRCHRSARLHHARHASRRACRNCLPKSRCPRTLDWDLWLGGAAPRVPSAAITCPTTGAGSSISAPGRSAIGPPTPPVPCIPRCNWARPPAWSASAVKGRSKITYPDRAIVRLEFPGPRRDAGRQRSTITMAARAGDPDAYHVPGMENETILPPRQQSDR